MPFYDIFRLALRNLREAKLRAGLTTTGVVIGVAVIVTMVSFGLGLQRNTIERFRELDLFSEITVYGRDMSSVVMAALGRQRGGGEGEGGDAEKSGDEKKDDNGGGRRSSSRALDDAAIAEIEKVPGVAYVEPNVSFTLYVRSNGRARRQTVGGVRIPNAASRFQKFSAGAMVAANDSEAAVVDSAFLKAFGYKNAADALGKTVELLAPPPASGADEAAAKAGGDAGRRQREAGTGDAGEDEPLTFFGLPLGGADAPGGGGQGAPSGGAGGGNEGAVGGAGGGDGGQLVARAFHIDGVLEDEVSDRPGGGGRFRGLMPEADIYVPLPYAIELGSKNRDALSEVALRLARASGALKEGETEGYRSATVRVSDPVLVKEVEGALKEKGFATFGILNELDEIRTVFLVINSALGLLGGISLLVASFGIANTMIMSILERTREIGIMKAIGAEDREIRLIFFVEASVIGLAGGVVGALAAWGIDRLANLLAYRFIFQPRGAPFVDFFSLPPWLWLGSILFAILVSVLAALYPASRAARIDPVKALRHD